MSSDFETSLGDTNSGTDVSDNESTYSNSSIGGSNKHHSRKFGSVIIKHPTNASMDGTMDLIQKMTSRWDVGDMNDSQSDVYNNTNNNAGGGHNKTLSIPAGLETVELFFGDEHRSVGGGGHSRKLSAADEMNIAQAQNEMIESIFDEFIDPECNGDVDVEEWCLGLSKINTPMNDSQMRQVFSLITKHDNEYIDRSDFVTFVTLRSNNPEIHVLQQPIIDAVRDSNMMLKNRTNLYNPKESVDWSNLDVRNVETEMLSVMQGLVDGLQGEVDKEEKFREETMKHLESHPEFFDNENPEELNLSTANKWSKFEVCLWVQSLDLDPRYSKFFADENVDGEMLIYDIEENMLIHALGIKPIHAKRFMRALYDLKICVRVSTDLLLDTEHELCEQSIFDFGPLLERQKMENDFEQALADVEQLKKSKEKLKEFYENQLKIMQTKVDELEVENKELKKQKKRRHYSDDESDDSTDDEEEESPETTVAVVAVVEGDHALNVEVDVEVDVEIKNEDDIKMEIENKEEIPSSVEMKDEEKDGKEDELLVEMQEEHHQKKPKTRKQKYKKKRKPSFFEKPLDSWNLHSKNKRATIKQTTKLTKALKTMKSQSNSFAIEDSDTIMQWTNREVAYWMCSIGFEQYAMAFYATPIDGDMLIRDLNRETLIEDLSVKKIHSARILRHVHQLRIIINEGYDEVLCESVQIEPDFSRPTMDTINSLQDRMEELQDERQQLIEELESKVQNEEDDGYFASKIKDLEEERNDLTSNVQVLNEQLEGLKSDHTIKLDSLQENIQLGIQENEELHSQMKQLKKEYRRKKRADGSESDSEEEKDDDSSESEDEIKIEDDEDYEIIINTNKTEIEKIIHSEIHKIKNFGIDERVLDWTPAEVGNWLHIIQFDKYMEIFFNTTTDGSMLVQDIGRKILNKWGVSSMHIKKLLREIQALRDSASELGCNILLSEEIKCELDPEYARLQRNKKLEQKKLSRKSLKKPSKSKKMMEDFEQQLQKYMDQIEDQKEQMLELDKIAREEKQQRIGFELEVERLTSEMNVLQEMGSDKKMATLQSLIEYERRVKIKSIEDLSFEINGLRKACKVMDKHIRMLNNKGFHPMDSLVGALGYSTTRY